jgi:NitT/TauT family transport system substrate-binding protein
MGHVGETSEEASVKHYAKLLAAGLTAALVLAGCSGDGDDEPTTTDEPTDTTEPDADEDEPADDAATDDEAAADLEPASVTFVTAAAVILPKEEVATYAVPEALGFFEEEALEVEVVTADGSTAAIQAVASGSADITAADLGSLYAAVEQGVPVTGLGGLVVNWPWRIAVESDSDIQACGDLAGTSIGIISLASGSNPFARSFVEECGLDPDSDVELVPVGLGPQAAAALQGGEVESLALFTQAYANLELAGLDFRFLDNPEIFDPLVSLTWIVANDFLEQNPDVIERFLRAANKGLLYSNADPTEAMRVSYDILPDLLGDRSAEDRLEDDAYSLGTWLETTALEGPVDSWGSFGELNSEQLEATMDFAITAGTVSEAYPVEDAFDDQLLSGANDFDRDEVLSLLP